MISKSVYYHLKNEAKLIGINDTFGEQKQKLSAFIFSYGAKSIAVPCSFLVNFILS